MTLSVLPLELLAAVMLKVAELGDVLDELAVCL